MCNIVDNSRNSGLLSRFTAITEDATAGIYSKGFLCMAALNISQTFCLLRSSYNCRHVYQVIIVIMFISMDRSIDQSTHGEST